MDISTRRPAFGAPVRMRTIVVLALVALLIAGLVVVAAGSRPARVPAPFGPARNGTWLTSSNGDIYALDPDTTSKTALVAGEAGFDFSPVYSRDGSKVTFLRSDGPLAEPAILSLMVMDADGSNLRSLTPPTPSLDWFDWSPAGTQIAYMAAGKLWVVGLDGTPPTKLAIGASIHFPTWLPPDGRDILVRRGTDSPAIMAIRPDGTGLRQVSASFANNEFDYQSIAVAPDGSEVTFTRWSADAVPRVYALDLATGRERIFPTAEDTGQRGGAVFSPDGTLVAYARIFREGAFQLVVANADGSGGERPIGPRKPGPPDGSEVAATWAFTPDGTALVARYGGDDDAALQLLPLDGSPGSVVDAGAFEFVDIQRLAP